MQNRRSTLFNLQLIHDNPLTDHEVRAKKSLGWPFTIGPQCGT